MGSYRIGGLWEFTAAALAGVLAVAAASHSAAGPSATREIGFDIASSYVAYDGELSFVIDSAAGKERVVLVPVLQSLQTETPTDAPIAGLDLRSVTPAGGGRYSVNGIALDSNGNPACALGLASGRCMFTCGEGSLRCEGGTDSLPFGEFELLDLPTEADGTINLQVFVEGHVSRTNRVYPSGVPTDRAGWGVVNLLPCPESPSTFSALVDGVTKRSVLSSPEAEPSWEGWAAAVPGVKAVSVNQVAGGCGELTGSFSAELGAGRCYLFLAQLGDDGDPSLSAGEVDCGTLP